MCKILDRNFKCPNKESISVRLNAIDALMKKNPLFPQFSNTYVLESSLAESGEQIQDCEPTSLLFGG